MTAALPNPEVARLEALRQYQIFDLDASEAFNDITRLAALVCGTPIAAIAWVDAKEHWFKSKVGWMARENSAEMAFCAHAIVQNEVTIVRDAASDERFATNPLVTSDPYIRFYAGAPLITPDRLALATLYVMDYVPRDLKPEQIEALKVLSRQAITQLELRRNLAEVARNNNEQKYAKSYLQKTYDELEKRTDELALANEKLQNTLAELLSAEEELHQQNEELNAAREATGLECQRYQDLFDFAPDGYLVTDAAGLVQEANRAAANLLSIRQERLVGKPLSVFVHQNDRKQFRTQLNNLQQVQHWEVRLQPRKRASFPAAIAVAAVRDRQGNLVGWRWLLRDISDRQRAEQKIREQAALLDITKDAILVQSLENQILFWNKGAEHLYGIPAQEALGKNANELLYKETSPQLKEAFDTVVECGSWQGELYQLTKDAKEIIVESRWTLVCDEREQPKSILVVNTDITNKKQLEAQFLRAQRMESIGTLASGIAHDLNNVLAPIQMAVQLLEKPLPSDKSQQLLGILKTNAKRGANLVKQVLSFGRGFESKQTLFQVKHLISEIRQIAKQTFPKSIEIYTDIDPDIWTIFGDITQLHQILMNLCVNARDAMPDGGTLGISASNIFIDEQYVKMHLDAKVGSYIVITVSDTGTGIPPEILDRIFEPFFTTKEIGKGTGLGLAIALGIVKSHGGFVNVNSKVGKGTEFKVYLPAVEATPEGQDQTQPASEEAVPTGNGEWVLVVDDEPAIRDITKKTLETYDYKVMTADNGVDAVVVYAQHRQEISVVVTDIMMPDMDGLTTIRTLQKINPEVKIVGVSGLPSNEKLASDAGASVKAFLCKPFTAKELLKTLDGVISQQTRN
jgi:PAS domain S-box-containing protein